MATNNVDDACALMTEYSTVVSVVSLTDNRTAEADGFEALTTDGLLEFPA